MAKKVATPSSLPQLTRILPLEFKVRKAKRTTDEEIRALLANFDSTGEGAAKSWRRVKKLADARKIAIDPAKTPELVAWRTAAEAEPDPEDPNESEEDERDGDVFEMSFSSETAVPRWFGDEILDHAAGSIDMSRASNGLAYLVDHDTGAQVGIIENFRVENGKTRGDVRFSRSARGQDIKRDVEDGIRPFVSIGYRVMEMVLEKETEDKSTYRITRWMPMEGSTVAVPADVTVGVGRSAEEREFPIQVRSAIQNPAPPAPTIEVRSMNPKQLANVMRLCQTHGVEQKRALEIVEAEGMTEERAASEILAEVAKRGAKPLTTLPAEGSEGGSMLTLTEREQNEYNICRGIMTLVRNVENNSRDKSFETEVSDEIAKRYEGKQRGGLFIPYKLRIDPSVIAKRGVATALAAGTGTQGAETVFTEPGEFIQFLYNRMRLRELGARVISGLQGNVAFPKQTGKASGSWVEENPGADVADSNLTLTQVTMSPKTYQSSASYSRQLLAQSVVDVDNLVRSDLATDVALALDLAGISGTGGSNDPKGILHTTGVGDYILRDDAGNGALPVWDDITLMEEELENTNADQLGDPAWLTTPGIKGLFKRTPRLFYAPAGLTATVNVTGDPIWTDSDEIDGYMARASNQVPKTLTKGTSAGNVHALILGVFSVLINGLWGSGFELVVDPYRLKKQGLIELTTFVLTDWANRYPAAFQSAVDCLKS